MNTSEPIPPPSPLSLSHWPFLFQVMRISIIHRYILMSNQTSAVASISTSAAASTAARRLAQIGQHMGMATQSTTNEKDGQKKGEEKIIKVRLLDFFIQPS